MAMAIQSADEWFAALPPDRRRIAELLRAAILACAPGVVEAYKWSRPCYSKADGMFCYLFNSRHHLTIGFDQGTSLRDPDGLLEGEGKQMRHVKIHPAAFDQPAVEELIRQAGALG